MMRTPKVVKRTVKRIRDLGNLKTKRLLTKVHVRESNVQQKI